MQTQIIHFLYEKETKNKVRFQEVERAEIPIAVGTLYVDKSAAGGAKKLKVTIEATE